jgi:holo-[acyl-carrier protein] synthase
MAIAKGHMVAGIGVDIVDVAAFADCVRDSGDDYLKRIFTEKEMEYCDSVADSMESYAARLAAKESAMKALGTGWDQGLDWHDFEILDKASGEPIMTVSGKAAELLNARSISTVWVSLSHVANYAVAYVMFERTSSS